MEKRNTIQRELILKAVAQLGNHPTADEVYAQVIKYYHSISKGTVYRNLALLAAEKKILKISMPNGADHYDHNTFDHCHVRCSKCGEMSDIIVKTPDILGSIIDNGGYNRLGFDIVFSGICPKCDKEETR